MKKSINMKPETIHQEILLFTGTSFSNKEYCLKDPVNKETTDQSPLEQLEKACWLGLLCELLPELFVSTISNCKTYIWNILRGQHFLTIHMGNCQAPIEKDFSIDPYYFLPSLFNN